MECQYWILVKHLMNEFFYDYIKLKHKDNAKLCYMDTDNFIIHIKTEHLKKSIAHDVKKWFDTSNYNEDDKRPVLNGMSKKGNWSFQR